MPSDDKSSPCLWQGELKSHMNASVAIQDQLKTIEVSVLISCIASICHVYMKFPLQIKDLTFVLIVLEKHKIVGWNIGNFRQI